MEAQQVQHALAHALVDLTPAPCTPFEDAIPEFTSLHGPRKAAALATAREHRRKWNAGSSTRRLIRHLCFPNQRRAARELELAGVRARAAIDAAKAITDGVGAQRWQQRRRKR